MSEQDGSILHYVHDPMCSWCWGFRPTWMKLRESLPEFVAIRYVLGGLAPDSDQPMDVEMRQRLQDTWRRIQNRIPGTEFNFDFWTECRPRRSTYPACRAVIAARHQGEGLDQAMTLAIQRAYYTLARNPSERETLLQLAQDLNLDLNRFAAELDSDETRAELNSEIRLSTQMGVRSFPSLVLETQGSRWPIAVQYTDHRVILTDIEFVLPESQ